MPESELRIGVIYPQVLGTYGDTGNALVLAERARRRGWDAAIEMIGLSDPIPAELDIYVLGGGEDTAQALAAARMRADRGLRDAVRDGRPVLAICASLQVLGRWYTDAQGREVEGLGLLDVVTRPRGERAIGELVAEPLIPGLTELLTGFENHGGGTCLGPDAAPLGRVLAGVGNGPVPTMGPVDQGGSESSPSAALEFDEDGTREEGAVQGSIVATYLHGPALARNPQLADLLLAQALGVEVQHLPELQVPGIDRLRQERLAAAGVEQDRS